MANLSEMIKQYVDADEERKKLDQLAKDKKAVCDEIRDKLIEAFNEQGVSKMTAHGRTVYLTSSFQAKPIEGQSYMTIASALVDTDHEALLTVNSRTMTSFVKAEIERYMAENDLDMADEIDYDSIMPKELRGKLEIGVYTSIATRKA